MRKKLCNIMCVLAVMVLGCEVGVSYSDPEQWNDISSCIETNGVWVSDRCEYRSCKNGVLTTCSSVEGVEGNDCQESLCEEDICNKLGTDCGYKNGTERCRDLTDQKGILETYSENDDIWEKTKSCEGFSCQDKKECGECLNNTRRCNNNLLKECKSGTWKEITSCECNQEGTDCKYNNEELRCRNIDDKSGIVEKYLDGNWEKTSSCSDGQASCQSLTECGECLNGTQQCDNESLKICGTGKWDTIQSCECNQEGTDCKYDNGELRCRNIDDKSGIVEKYLDGNWEKTLSCSNGQASCQSSRECGECLNGTQQCDNEGLKICDTGKWNTIQSCECNEEGTDCRYNNEDLRCRNIDDKSGIIEKYLDGNWEKTSSCSEGKASCQSSTKCGKCLNGTQQCSKEASGYRSICKDGMWENIVCPSGCSNGECIDINNDTCTESDAGNLKCIKFKGSGSGVFVCDNMKWTTTDVTCSDGMCNDKYTNCNDSSAVCNKGYKKCGNDNKLYICENGKWEGKDFGKYEQCQNGKYVNLKDNCENSSGVFSDGQCICVGNDRLYTCSDLNCTTLSGNTCEAMKCNDGVKYNKTCVAGNLYTCNNSEWVLENQMKYSEMYDYYNNLKDKMNLQKFNKKVIEGLMDLDVDMPCNYEITISSDGNSQCVFAYDNEGFDFCSKILENKLIHISLQSDGGSCGAKEVRLEQCSIIIEKCENTDISNPDNMTFKLNC